MSENTRRMYELEYPSPEVKSPDQSGPTLVIALQGYADAGHAVENGSKHLLAALDSRPIASFNNDELIDYRSRRPSVTIDRDHVSSSEQLNLNMSVLRDSEGKTFLLLSGPEPDLRWEAFTDAVADLVEKFGVEQTISLYAAPMTVPHTRPMVVSAHGNDRDLVGRMVNFDSRLVVPGSASLHIERELHRRGLTVAGYTAHVPHYLAASPYPEATLKLLEAVSDGARLELPLLALENDARRVSHQLVDQVEENGEIQQVVRALEVQYDEEFERYRQNHPQAALPGEQEVPSGDELGEQFEKFLAKMDDSSGTDVGPGVSQLWDGSERPDSATDDSAGGRHRAEDEDDESGDGDADRPSDETDENPGNSGTPDDDE